MNDGPEATNQQTTNAAVKEQIIINRSSRRTKFESKNKGEKQEHNINKTTQIARGKRRSEGEDKQMIKTKSKNEIIYKQRD